MGQQEFVKYDTIQLTTLYTSGRLTYRRGVMYSFKIENDEYVCIGTCNSTLDKYVCGTTIIEDEIEGELVEYMTGLFSYKITSILPLRMVLVEKFTKNRMLLRLVGVD